MQFPKQFSFVSNVLSSRRGRGAELRLSRRRRPPSSYQVLEPRQLLAAVISEFSASNSNVITDDNGNSTDWIEIYNTSQSPISLNGYSLTDDPSDTTKYVFSNTFLVGEAYLIRIRFLLGL